MTTLACRVPNCSTKYRELGNKQTMFKAPSEKQLSDWREILSARGVHDFGPDHRICILHFKENDIERDRVIYKAGGIVTRQPRKVPLLTYTAVPTIFPPKDPATMTKQQRNKQLEYSVTLDPLAIAEHRKVLERDLKLTNTAVPTIIPRKEPANMTKQQQKPKTRPKVYLEQTVTLDPLAIVEQRKVLKPDLKPTCTALPTIIPSKKPASTTKQQQKPKTRPKVYLEQTVTLDPLAIVEQRKVLEPDLKLTRTALPTIVSSKDSASMTKQQQKRQTRPISYLEQPLPFDSLPLVDPRSVLKREHSSDDADSRDDSKSAKHPKTSNLFQSIVDMIHEDRRVSLALSTLWIPIVLEGTCIRWSIWRANRSIEEKIIILHADLRVEVFMQQQKIVIPEADKIVEMSDLENVFRQVSKMIPCKKADYELEESGDDCLGFVTRNFGRPRIWCAPCCKYQRNLKRRVTTRVQTARQRLHLRYNKLRHRNKLLKSEVKALENNVQSLKNQCISADKVALDEAFALTPSNSIDA